MLAIKNKIAIVVPFNVSVCGYNDFLMGKNPHVKTPM